MKIVKKCEAIECENNFYTSQKRLNDGRGRFCSKECFYRNRKKDSKTDCVICGTEVYMRPSRIKQIKEGTSCSKKCYAKYLSNVASKRVIKGHKDNNLNMVKGCGITNDGYVWIYKKGEHNNQIKLHRYLMEVKLGRKLFPNEIVHHIDENKLNNDIENLMIVTRREHNKLHKFLER